jgi:hypothetical protein
LERLVSNNGQRPSTSPSIAEVLAAAPWRDLAEHVSDWRERIDRAIRASHDLRRRYREELLAADPNLPFRIHRPSPEALARAISLMQTGTVAAADGTVSQVPLVSGAKIQVGVAIVFNSGQVVDLVTRVFEHELATGADTATEYFARLRRTRQVSYLVSHAIMLFGERQQLMAQSADWRMIHGELIPHELRTGAGRPADNLSPTFDLIDSYIASKRFLACSESTSDLDVLNAAELLKPGEFVVIRSLEEKLRLFLEGDEVNGTVAAKFADADARRFRAWMAAAGPQVAEVLVKAGERPFLIECHADHIDDAVALFLVDSLWMRGHALDGSQMTVRGFPFHIDLADQAVGTLFRASDFRGFVEHRLMEVSVEDGLFDLDPRRTR